MFESGRAGFHKFPLFSGDLVHAVPQCAQRSQVRFGVVRIVVDEFPLGQVIGDAAPMKRDVIQSENYRSGGANLRFGVLPDVALPVLAPVSGAPSNKGCHLLEKGTV